MHSAGCTPTLLPPSLGFTSECRHSCLNSPQAVMSLLRLTSPGSNSQPSPVAADRGGIVQSRCKLSRPVQIKMNSLVDDVCECLKGYQNKHLFKFKAMVTSPKGRPRSQILSQKGLESFFFFFKDQRKAFINDFQYVIWSNLECVLATSVPLPGTPSPLLWLIAGCRPAESVSNLAWNAPGSKKNRFSSTKCY